MKRKHCTTPCAWEFLSTFLNRNPRDCPLFPYQCKREARSEQTSAAAIEAQERKLTETQLNIFSAQAMHPMRCNIPEILVSTSCAGPSKHCRQY